MSKKSIATVVALAASLALPSTAQAADLTVTKIVDQPFDLIGGTAKKYTLAGFDQKLGKLTAVDLSVIATQRLYGSVPADKPSESFFDIEWVATQTFSASIPSGGLADSSFVMWASGGSGTFNLYRDYDRTVVAGLGTSSTWQISNLDAFLSPVTVSLYSEPVYSQVSAFNFKLDSSAKILLTYTYDAVAPVPEPNTWAMMMLGFGLVGAGLRSRRLSGSSKNRSRREIFAS